nr:PhzF family phenazine biosynthesis protein [uncultured Draconibacterium sp.]
MAQINYHIVDVFTSRKYGGNQLAVFIDYEDIVSEKNMLEIARVLNFSEVTFVKKNIENREFEVRIFTPEYEVPFAGHPTLGTAFVISKYLIPASKDQLTIRLKHSKIDVTISSPKDVDSSFFVMQQAAPEFLSGYDYNEVEKGLGLEVDTLDKNKPIEEISTGLPYLILPVLSLKKLNPIKLNVQKVIDFLIRHNKYKTNSAYGLTTSLFFVTEETYEKQSNFNARMFCIEQERLVEDAATGSANGCFLAYLLKNDSANISAIVEQGFQLNRKSYIHLYGKREENKYLLEIGGQVVDVSRGVWNI